MSVNSEYTCTCGHAPEEHGNDKKHKGSTACDECDCCAYDADAPEDEDETP
jgi:hypothetical protein